MSKPQNVSDDIAWIVGQSKPITHGSLPDKYLKSRGITRVVGKISNDLREDHLGNMLALIRDKEGVAISYQRTFLKQNQDGTFTKERKMKKGVKIPHGSSIRLYDQAPMMGVAESTENALVCAKLFQVPTWALLSASQMERWVPPEGTKRLLIFADNDRSMTGELAARNLANEVGARGIKVSVYLPKLDNRIGEVKFGDWNDFLTQKDNKQCLSM